MLQYFCGNQGSVGFFWAWQQGFYKANFSYSKHFSRFLNWGGHTNLNWARLKLGFIHCRCQECSDPLSVFPGSWICCILQKEEGYLTWSRADGWQNNVTKLRRMKSRDTGEEKSEFLFLLWKIRAGQYLLQSRWHSFPSFTLLGRLGF